MNLAGLVFYWLNWARLVSYWFNRVGLISYWLNWAGLFSYWLNWSGLVQELRVELERMLEDKILEPEKNLMVDSRDSTLISTIIKIIS